MVGIVDADRVSIVGISGFGVQAERIAGLGAGAATGARHRVAVIGSLGVMSPSKQRGVIAEMAPLVKAMVTNGIYFADPLLQTFLAAQGESWSSE